MCMKSENGIVDREENMERLEECSREERRWECGLNVSWLCGALVAPFPHLVHLKMGYRPVRVAQYIYGMSDISMWIIHPQLHAWIIDVLKNTEAGSRKQTV